MKITLRIIILTMIWLLWSEYECIYLKEFYFINTIFTLSILSVFIIIFGFLIKRIKYGNRIINYTKKIFLHCIIFIIIAISIDKIYDKVIESKLVRLVCTLEKFKVENGKFPEKLSDLNKGYKYVFTFFPNEFLYEFSYYESGKYDQNDKLIWTHKISEKDKLIGYRTPLNKATKLIIEFDKNNCNTIHEKLNKFGNLW